MSPDDGKRLRQVSLLEIAEDVMRRQGIQKLPASEHTKSPPAGLQKMDSHIDSHTDREQSRRFCVNIPCIPLNLEVPLPTLYVLTVCAHKVCFAHLTSQLLFRDFDNFKCILNRVGNDVASDLGSSWLHASQ